MEELSFIGFGSFLGWVACVMCGLGVCRRPTEGKIPLCRYCEGRWAQDEYWIARWRELGVIG